MKRYAAISAALTVLTISAVAAPVAGAAPRNTRHTARHARTVRFYATVVRADSKGLIVRTTNGRTLRFSAAQIARARRPLSQRHHRARRHRRGHVLRRALDAVNAPGPVAINIVGLQPGVTVLITESVATDGTITITITLPPATGTQETAAGVVGDVGNDDFGITTADGTDLRFHMSADALSNLNLQSCDTVSVTYHQDAGFLIADQAQVTGASSTGDCAPTYDATGSITQVSATGLTIQSDQGAMSFAVSDSSVTDGFQNGDVVDVTYTQNSDGSLSATDVQYVESESTGTVTSVSSSSVTITDSSSGQSETFVADPNNGLQMTTYAFDGIKVGDALDVNYHQSGNSLIADCVNDQPPGASNGS